MIERIKTIINRVMKKLKQVQLSENEKRCLERNCTCTHYDFSPLHYGEGENYRFCGCYTCADPICVKERLERKRRDKEEYERFLKWANERDASCTCKLKDDYYHNNDQGGYLCCSCDTCIDPECIANREEYKEREQRREQEEYRTYLRLKEKFER